MENACVLQFVQCVAKCSEKGVEVKRDGRAITPEASRTVELISFILVACGGRRDDRAKMPAA